MKVIVPMNFVVVVKITWQSCFFFRSSEAYTGDPTSNTTLDYKRNFNFFRLETTSRAPIKESFFLACLLLQHFEARISAE